jgi:hypothetical protein
MKGDIKMKKIIFAIAIVLTMTFCANAQSDGFFRGGNDYSYGNRDGDGLPGVPSSSPDNGYYNYNTTDVPAPLGTGLLVMTALGAGYAMAKRRKK